MNMDCLKMRFSDSVAEKLEKSRWTRTSDNKAGSAGTYFSANKDLALVRQGLCFPSQQPRQKPVPFEQMTYADRKNRQRSLALVNHQQPFDEEDAERAEYEHLFVEFVLGFGLPKVGIQSLSPSFFPITGDAMGGLLAGGAEPPVPGMISGSLGTSLNLGFTMLLESAEAKALFGGFGDGENGVARIKIQNHHCYDKGDGISFASFGGAVQSLPYHVGAGGFRRALDLAQIKAMRDAQRAYVVSLLEAAECEADEDHTESIVSHHVVDWGKATRYVDRMQQAIM